MQTTIEVPKVSSKALWAGRIISGLVVLFLLFDASIKLIPLDIVNETSRELGIPEHLARTLGVLTLIGVILYVYPRTSVLGAIFLTGYLGGAVYVHVRAGSPLFSHTLFGIYLGLLIWGGLYLRDGMVRALIPLRR
jgi:hypothetical protein